MFDVNFFLLFETNIVDKVAWLFFNIAISNKNKKVVIGCLYVDRLRTSSRSRVHSALATDLRGDVDEATVVDLSLLSTTSLGLLLFLLSDLGSLRLDLTGTSQRTVNFTLFFMDSCQMDVDGCWMFDVCYHIG